MLTKEKAEDQWHIYQSLRRDQKKELASKTWRRLLNEGERTNFVTQLDQAKPEAMPEHGIRGLMTSGLWDEDAPAYLEPELVMVILSTFAGRHRSIALPSLHRVNYHGHLCALVKDASGKVMRWSEIEGAFRVEERTKVTIVVFIQSTSAGLSTMIQHAEMEVVGGANRMTVPFQVEAEGYPLRFLERSRYEKLQVPAKGKSEIMYFPVHPESLIHRSGETNRVPVWVNCRQNNSLVQCVCVPLRIVPRKKPQRAKTKKSK
ncbi:MAG: hypothetical protein R3F13_15975 [Prosthecobacter sp.]